MEGGFFGPVTARFKLLKIHRSIGAAGIEQLGFNMTIDSPVVEDAAVAPGNRQLVPIEIAHADLYHRAAQTWRGLKNAQRQAWDQYVIIGEAMAAARAMIMRQRHLNQPAGPSYQRAFREWLASFGLDDMDKGTRSRLCGLIDHLPEVQGMMAAWSDAERADRGHPNTVHRYFQKWLAKMGQPNTAKAKLLDRAKRTAATASENKQLKAEAERSAAYIA